MIFWEYAYKVGDGPLLRKITRKIKGAVDLSDFDADGWRRILTSSFDGCRQNLCTALGQMAKKLYSDRNCTSKDFLKALLTCKLISVDKTSGARPVGIGEVVRRLIVTSLTLIIVLIATFPKKHS